MRTHHTVTLFAAGLLALTGCSEATSEPQADAKVASSPSASQSSVSPEALSSAAAAAGIPPSPAPEQRAIYLAALNKIDPEIVNGKDDKAISRGLSQCQSMKDEKDPTKRVESTNRRFISPNHPDGFGPTKAAFILAAVQTNLCPTY
ncbi:DUF732 domain-containing protein [Streptomyces sp. NPDC054949]|uniref:DUF732 domain-containing protein n=1 Tax=unclassified Streptomyces TaxID=2593676 RepID=UPI00225689F1|nr:DUF732 domain-containing protein [Streptomyces sp. NBC_00424]MCX5071027.1 hypothetical protein [Streptomyces sp. NBC_00424]WUD45539.1 hypothetical protein OHA84_36335 [Streptomyces sp. NBC_00513]